MFELLAVALAKRIEDRTALASDRLKFAVSPAETFVHGLAKFLFDDPAKPGRPGARRR